MRIFCTGFAKDLKEFIMSTCTYISFAMMYLVKISSISREKLSNTKIATTEVLGIIPRFRTYPGSEIQNL